MGSWAAHIEGHGIHDNGKDEDAEVMLRGFVADLQAKGHAVASASFTVGSGRHLPLREDGQADADAPYQPH